jgi:carbamate kinase
VEKVSLNFKKSDQKDLDYMTVAECEQYIAEGHFAPGSMLPKIQAAMTFANLGSGRKSIIASLYNAVDALKGHSGTVITLETINSVK